MELPGSPVYLKYASVGREQHIMFCVEHNTFNQRESDTQQRDSGATHLATPRSQYIDHFILRFPDTDTSQRQ